MPPNNEKASFEPSGDQVGSVAPQVTLSDSDASVTTRRLSSARQQAARISVVVLLDGRVMHRSAAGSLHEASKMRAAELPRRRVGRVRHILQPIRAFRHEQRYPVDVT